jgi:hypothetical protein
VVNAITRDSFGNPAQASFTISGPTAPYAICIKLLAESSPSYNKRAGSAYDTYTYSSGGTTYKPCKKFSWGSGTSNTQSFGANFTFGGPGTYEVHWYVPDVPANGGIEVGAPQTFAWADSADTFSPCPPDPQLQIGVWRPSRHKVLNRCKTLSGTATSGAGSPNSLDKDIGWSLAKVKVENMLRDNNFLPKPSKGSTWTIVGVSVCDLYHGWKEMHPVFQATNGSGTTYLSGPQYSTATPSVSGTWSLHSCG